jgi:hypothetical protein
MEEVLYMDFMKAVSFPFEDEEWLKKLGLGVLIQFIPIAGALALSGWAFEISKRVKNNDPEPLPDWSNFGGHIGKGFMLFLAMLVYQIPTLLFACVIAAAQGALVSGAENEDALAAMGGVAGVIMVCCGCLWIIYYIVSIVVFMAGYTRYIDVEEFSTFMQFGTNFALVRENLGDFGMVILYYILAALIVGIASSITFGLLGLVATPVLMYFLGHLLGQLAVKLPGASPAE